MEFLPYIMLTINSNFRRIMHPAFLYKGGGGLLILETGKKKSLNFTITYSYGNKLPKTCNTDCKFQVLRLYQTGELAKIYQKYDLPLLEIVE